MVYVSRKWKFKILGGLNMQYNICINQEATLKNKCFSDLDLIDLALFDFIYHFFNCDSPKKVTFRYNNVEYTEIRLNLIEQEMPLLKFGCRKTFITRMSKLVSAGLICRYENNAKENRSGYCRGENFSKMIFSKQEKEEQQGEKKMLQGCEFKVIPPVTSDSHKHIHKDNIDINKEERDKSLSKKDEPFEECWKAYQRRGSKAKAKTYWDKLSNDEKELVKQHIPAYVASVSEKKYIMYFERYLKDKFFNNVVYKGNTVLFDPEHIKNEGEYHPKLDGFNLRWIESEKCYMTPFDLDMLVDGYTKENRPASAMVMKNGIKYIWNTESKQWKIKR